MSQLYWQLTMCAVASCQLQPKSIFIMCGCLLRIFIGVVVNSKHASVPREWFVANG